MANGCVKVLVLLVVALTLADCDAVSFRRQKRQSLGDLLPLWISRRWTSLSGKPPIQEAIDAVAQARSTSQPKEVLNWPSVPLQLGQISGVSVDQESNPVILHRGPVVWDGSSFDGDHYNKVKEGPIDVDTVVVLDETTGTPINQWGRQLFYMPHGLHIDGQGNTWVTDVALHQVMKFPKGSTQPSLTLGEAFKPGRDDSHFCKPTDVAVSSAGIVFVADGYCNQRIMKFSADGKLLDTFSGSFNVPHSLALIEEQDLLCVADRENSRVVCLHAGLKSNDADVKFGHPAANSQQGSLGRVYAVASDGRRVYAVTGPSFPFRKADGYTLWLGQLKVLNTWSPSQGFGNPHDVTVSHDGTALYTVQIGPNRITKFALN